MRRLRVRLGPRSARTTADSRHASIRGPKVQVDFSLQTPQRIDLSTADVRSHEHAVKRRRRQNSSVEVRQRP